MALYLFKPVVWNEHGYQRPGGARFTSGYPAEHGFGHEEWNNSARLEFFDERGQKFRIFHTEPVGNQPLSKTQRQYLSIYLCVPQREAIPR
jgi:hypothetical protein